jgi:hypothetical protein
MNPASNDVDPLEDVIADEQYYTFPRTCVTVCCLTLTNGFAVAGYAVCSNHLVYNVAEGRRRARARAKLKVGELEVYRQRPPAPVVRQGAIRFSPSQPGPLEPPSGPVGLDTLGAVLDDEH